MGRGGCILQFVGVEGEKNHRDKSVDGESRMSRKEAVFFEDTQYGWAGIAL